MYLDTALKRAVRAFACGRVKALCILICLCLIFTCSAGCGSVDVDVAAVVEVPRQSAAADIKEQKLICRSIESEQFHKSVRSPRIYEADGFINAGVVPHHTVGASLISGFFELVSNDGDYDTVVVVAPNHDGDIADVILSLGDWEAGGEVLCDRPMAQAILDLNIDGVSIVTNDERMVEDHSASVMIPYIRHYLPEAKAVPVLVSRTLTLDETLRLAGSICGIIKEADKKVLLVCSVDFSHYLMPEEAADNGKETIEAIMNLDYKRLHDYSNEYMDSPPSLIIFLLYLSSMDIQPQVLDYADASEFLGPGVPETTSYFVMIG